MAAMAETLRSEYDQLAPKVAAGCRPRRVLITGATGLLGRQVLRVFQEHGWEVRGVGHSRAVPPIVKCNLLVDTEIKVQLDEFAPTILIHCAAERRPDRLEGKEEYAKQINVGVPDTLAQLCQARNIWMLYMSTNYVFDGKAAPYAEDAAANPLSTYGWSKLEGERCVLKVHPSAAILRVPLLYGPLEYLGETSVTALLDSVSDTTKTPKFDDWQERFPTSSDDLALVIEAFSAAYILRGQSAPGDFAGNFHWQANQRHTKYTMALTIANITNLSTDHFIRVETAPAATSAARPQFERMLCQRIETLLGIKSETVGKFRSDFQELLARYLSPFIEAPAEAEAEKVVFEDSTQPGTHRQRSELSLTSSNSIKFDSSKIQEALKADGHVSCEHVTQASEAVDG